MASQIYAVPDENGVIRVACGGDTLEIVVVPREANETVSSTGSDDVYAAIVQRASGKGHRTDWLTMIDDPYVFAAPGKSGQKQVGHIDVDSLLKRIRAGTAARTNQPLGVVLRLDTAIDLHEMSRLSSELGKSLPSVGLAVDFGKALRRG